ncbi:helix-turn-helix domain-containing protein [Chitinophaga sp. SYP-B3965]|uniref:AraC family transcriptional regulator n=1 Tax=Chitinophaga sp. SYP-B3965 TaxID=2663120 RepID=UPI0012999156|nr:AraC family transcriptional regulator [Chitinophaga sp. SYP-B3965]MRG44685.1 helix-turn-helix domain-containing protein [Chitinophaga sp. SYP-B3965]
MLRKKEGFEGQRAIIIPRKIITDLCISNPVIEGAFVTDIGYYPKAKYHFRQRLHGIDQNILIYCVEGKGSAQIGKRKYSMGPDTFVVIPAGAAHSYAADENDSWTIYWAHFKGPVANVIVDAMIKQHSGHSGTITFQQKRLHLFEDIYTSLERGYGNDNLCYANMCLWHFLSSFMYDDKFNLSEKKQSTDVVELSINYMQQQLSQMLTLANLAQSVNLSASHYSSIFRKKTGFSPMEYFNHLKIQKACQYLIFTDLRVKEIAYKLGMEDPYYFSRMFNKLMGVSPNHYRTKRGSS